MTPEQFRAVFPDCPAPAVWSAAVSAAWQQWGFDNDASRAGYLGITGNECGGFTEVKRELMNYSPERARDVFGDARASRCEQYCGIGDGGRRFASCIYANMIGNGPPDTEDGWKYRGGGIIQLTGRYNYEHCGKALGVDLIANPDALTDDPAVSASAAAWFMAAHEPKILPLLKSGTEVDFLAGARLVGYPPPGATATRLMYWRRAMEVLGEKPQPRTLREGMSGDDVRQLQVWLNDHHQAILMEDGIYGRLTARQVRWAQKRAGVEADGVLGPVTRAAFGL